MATSNSDTPPLPPAFQTDNTYEREKPAYQILLCRETPTGGIEILNSRIVEGRLKPAYYANLGEHRARLLDSAGKTVSECAFEIKRKVHWTDFKAGTTEMVGGELPSSEVIFTIRVPVKKEAKYLQLVRLNRPEPSGSQAGPVRAGTTEILLRAPLESIPKAAESAK